MKFALFGSTFPDRNPKTVEQIIGVCETLKKYPTTLYLSERFFRTLPEDTQRYIGTMCELFDTQLPEVDMAMSVGGDGTFLRTASVVGSSGVPVLGINTGRLGFLAAVNYSDVADTIREVVQGMYEIENRTLLKMSAEGNCEPFRYNAHARNEVAIMKQDTASMLYIHAYINNDYLTSYQADGLVIATPTGSPAYSLSVGGSILAPATPSLILSAIAPHNLTSRSLVVDDNSKISLKVESRSKTFLVSLDGQSQVFDQEVEINLCKADYSLKVVKRVGHTFFETLRDKLMWGEDVRRFNKITN
jgi:NAD+ kinase